MKTQKTAMKMFSLATLIVVIFTASAAGDNDRDTVINALNQWKQSQKWHERFSVQVDTTHRAIAPVNEPRPSGRIEVIIKKMGSCMNISGYNYILDPEKAKFSQKMDIVVNNKLGLSRGHLIQKQPGAVNMTEKPSKMLNRYMSEIGMGSALDGYILAYDGKCLADIMLEANDLTFLGKELINGYPCLKISSKTRYGSVELWLDEKNGYLPRRYVVKQGSDDFCSEGKKLCESNLYGVRQGALKDVFVTSWSCVLDQVEISKVSESFFLREGRLITNHSRSNGKQFSGEYIYKRTKFDPAPDLSQKDFDIDIPNGVRVYNKDDPSSGVNYEWRDGKIVPAFSDFSGTAEGKWTGRPLFVVIFWLLAGVALLGVSLRYIWRYKKAGG